MTGRLRLVLFATKSQGSERKLSIAQLRPIVRGAIKVNYKIALLSVGALYGFLHIYLGLVVGTCLAELLAVLFVAEVPMFLAKVRSVGSGGEIQNYSHSDS